MCGIAGIFNLTSRAGDTAIINMMTRCIAHRGPDAIDVYEQGQIALGHARLSIIDLRDASNQPMSDVTGRYMIVFNGEIYNYQEVKAQLKGYPFKTESDTEVIMAAFDTWGPACLSRLNGMFALAIWDHQKEELFIARDRLGKKPLYYFRNNQFFLFGSEIRSLLSSGLINREVDETHLAEFLQYQAPLNDHTLVRGIHQLQAGHYAIVTDTSFDEKQYWSYELIEPADVSLEEAKKGVRDLFIDAVRLRMVSDVPIGAFLSGGIDSSLVVACLAELSSQPVNTYSISFDEKKFDESVYSDEIAKRYNTNHHRIVIRPESFLESIDDILGAMDSPSGDGPNTYLVSKRTKETGIKVALSGLGGDELFAGYNKFLLYHKIMHNKWVLKIPLALRREASQTIFNLALKHKNEKLADLIKLSDWNLSTIYPHLRRSYSPEEINNLLNTPYRDVYVESRLAAIDKAMPWMGVFSEATIGELETYTRDVLLRDTDQMAMAHALEVRVPFFDYRLVEYVLSLPDAYKFPHTPKKLLVDALAPRLPDSIVNRPKMGFTFPIGQWLKKELHGMADEKLHFLMDRKEFNGDAIRTKWKRYNEGDQRILWPRIWQLVVLSDWLQRNKL